ncbi:MAG: glycoside hydrolase family 18 protein [Verrucomicrobiales bacterium]
MPQITGGSANPNALRVNGPDDRDLKNLLESVYTHVIVCSFHFRNNTDFTPLYNGFSAAEYRAPWRDFQLLKQGENYKTLMISLGGWNNECWKHMQGKEDEAARKLAEFVDAHGFDGIDLNFEGDGYGNNHDAYRAAMGKCAESLRDHLGDRIITISPIFGDEAAKQLGEIKNAREVISWVNVQLYYYQNYNNTTGGHHNSPMDYSDAVAKTGFPASRVVAGFALNGAQPENDVTDAGNTQRAQMNAAELANCEGYVRAMVRNNSDFGGVFLWRYLKTMQPQQPDGKMLRWDSAMKAAMQPQGQIV